MDYLTTDGTLTFTAGETTKPTASGQSYTVPAGVVFVELTMTRTVAGQATTAPFTVVDGCGEWQTLVGGGRRPGSERARVWHLAVMDGTMRP